MITKDSYFHQLEASKKEFFKNSSVLMKECINLFQKNSGMTIRDIIESTQKNDLEELARHIQKLKGMLCFFPYFDAFLTCSDLADSLAHHSTDDIAAKVLFLQENLKDAQQTLQSYKDAYLT
ncbi:MAG: hypothetical protein N3A69_06085 [Leptospiraceae bacterium]|nr:hypothetical protein [Leptospiraceae bacterium]